MKFGSVRFFKYLILCSIILMILGPTALCIFFAVENNELSKELALVATADSRLTLDEQWVASIGHKIFADEDREYTLEYQKLYSDLYVERESGFKEDVAGSVYLTFDDGPSSMTPEVLKLLKEKDVKATFFVVYDDSPAAADLLQQMVAEGHTIGVHSTCHVYKQIYKSVEAYLTDFEETATWIEEVTGVRPEIFRFPGGSINTYNQNIYQPLIAEMLRRGYIFYDWNVSSGDVSESSSARTVLNDVLCGTAMKDKAIVLMHDAAKGKDTLHALPEIINQLKASGRVLLPLDNTVKPITFSYY